ncbi:MAG: glycosyltransferase [Flavobacteriales bacterium]
MKIAFLSTFYPYRGGIAQFNANLYRELEKKHTIKAYTFTRQYPNFLFPGKTQLVTTEDRADAIPSIRTLDTINPFTWGKTARKIAKDKPDILLMKYWMSFFGPSLGTVAGKLKRRGTKVITILDNVIPHEKRIIDKPFTNYFLKRNTGFVAMTKSVKDDLLSLRPNAPVILLPHPLYDHFGKAWNNAEARKKLGLRTDSKVLLFFGIIRDYKGLDLLIDAFGKLDKTYDLVIAGESYGSFEKYQQQIHTNPNKENIKVFDQYIGDDEVPVFFSASDVTILPYKSATQSGITSIAYHFEVPLIATDTGGLKETIKHGITGLIADKPDVELIKQRIEEFYSGNNAQNFRTAIGNLKEELSWKKFAEELIAFSKSL